MIMKKAMPADAEAQAYDEGYTDNRLVPELPGVLYVFRGADRVPWYFTSKAGCCFLWTGLYMIWHNFVYCCCITTVVYESRKVYTSKPKLPEITDHLEAQKAINFFEV